jgi:hypothetical protein
MRRAPLATPGVAPPPPPALNAAAAIVRRARRRGARRRAAARGGRAGASAPPASAAVPRTRSTPALAGRTPAHDPISGRRHSREEQRGRWAPPGPACHPRRRAAALPLPSSHRRRVRRAAPRAPADQDARREGGRGRAAAQGAGGRRARERGGGREAEHQLHDACQLPLATHALFVRGGEGCEEARARRWPTLAHTLLPCWPPWPAAAPPRCAVCAAWPRSRCLTPPAPRRLPLRGAPLHRARAAPRWSSPRRPPPASRSCWR